MPSLHFSWTILFGVLFLRTPNKWLKIFGVIYPTITLLAITITANHYIMDAIAGAALMVVAFALMELGFRRRLFLPKIWGYIQSKLKIRHAPPIPILNHNSLNAEDAPPAKGGQIYLYRWWKQGAPNPVRHPSEMVPI